MTAITLNQALAQGIIYKKGNFWYVKGGIAHFNTASEAYGYAYAHGLLPNASGGGMAKGVPLGTHTQQKEGSQNVSGAPPNQDLLPQLTIGSPLITWLAVEFPSAKIAPDEFLNWPIVDWPLWMDLVIFAVVGILLGYYFIHRR